MSDLLVLIGGSIIAVISVFFYGRTTGAKAERAKQDAERLKARTVADEIDDAIAGREPSENRAKLKTWGPWS